MPIAAVPAYLGTDFNEASPGLRFGMYLRLWGVNRRSQELLWTTYDLGYEVRGQQRQEREVKYENKGSALADAKKLYERDKDTMSALAARQAALAATVPADSLLRLEATAVSPFTTGLGNEHPLENGFAFLNPYGLPYLAGSGVKGVLRQAARELASGVWGETHGWSAEKNIPLLQGEGSRRKPVLDDRKQPVMLSIIDVLFGLESRDGEAEHVRGALTFWDVIPQIAGNSLMVEIMTPHQGHYYQAKPEPNRNDRRAHNEWLKSTAGSISPHDSGQPNPICFLTVPPGSTFSFHVTCDMTHLKRLAPDLLEPGPDGGRPRWQTLIQKAFEHAFEWLGFGAKTAVGYGAMETEAMRSCRQAREREWIAAEQETETMRREQEAVAKAETWPGARLKFNRANKTLSAEKDGKSAHALAPKGEELLASLPPEIRRKVESNQFVTAIAIVSGRDLLDIKP
jgi:CRISPR-associated protein Cmr6